MTALKKFTHRTMRISNLGKGWEVCVHQFWWSRGESESGIALVAERVVGSRARPVRKDKASLARETVFGKPLATLRTSSAALRRAVGSVLWGDSWKARPTQILGSTFDGVLVGRTLTAMGVRGAVDLEVGAANGCAVLRIHHDGRVGVVAEFNPRGDRVRKPRLPSLSSGPGNSAVEKK